MFPRILLLRSQPPSRQVHNARKLDYFDYSGEILAASRLYNIEGQDIKSNIGEFTPADNVHADMLTSRAVYKGKKNKEKVDYLLSDYYKDTDGLYKASRKSKYNYEPSGRLAATSTYSIKDDTHLLRRTTEFTGLKGREIVSLSYDYNTDGSTIYSVSVSVYDLAKDDTNIVIGGDGNKHTLDKITTYTGAADPHDQSGAIIKQESYYKGKEGAEQLEASFGGTSYLPSPIGNAQCWSNCWPGSPTRKSARSC